MGSIDKIQALYETEGVKPYGEQVSQLQHAIQVAKLAEENQVAEPLIAAALLHDIGHLLYNERIVDWPLNDRHEVLGASLLKVMFGEEVAEPVRLHVMAKRYLCGINHSYYNSLSDASKESLSRQGGALTDLQKRNAFERNRYFDQAIDLRHWDDEGKNEQDTDTDFSRFLPLLRGLKTIA